MELQPAHGLVGLTLVGAVAVHNVWMSIKVGNARKQYKVPYPLAYAPTGADHENEFNCVQRAHQNSLENLPTFYTMLLFAGAKYPIAASVAGLVYLAGRVQYFRGYSTGEPKNRMRGSFMYLGTLSLLGMVARWSIELLAPALKM